MAPRKVRPAELINQYYAKSPTPRLLLMAHSRLVCKRALKIARQLSNTVPVDLNFIAEAAMLHDIGMIMTHTPSLGCYGTGNYLRHGILGRDILEKEGLPRHALVCERHIGVGLTAQEIRQQQLELPRRDMRPVTLEEQIICYADLFFSKKNAAEQPEKSAQQVRQTLEKFGQDKPVIFDLWRERFEPELR